MRQVFEEREIEERGEESEFVLGSVGLLIVLAGVVAVCAACFGLGYAAGHRSSSASAAGAQAPLTNPDVPLTANASKQKPAATTEPAPPPPAESAAATPANPAADPDGDIVGGTAQAQTAPQPVAPANGGWSVKPALPAQSVQSSPAGSNPLTSSVTAGVGTIVVQIAAVSHIEDADVLMNALRRRGYAVSAHRDLTDNLIHVQVGPFASRNDAIAMRNKLLSDGYNAVVEP
jgi:DedD protein